MHAVLGQTPKKRRYARLAYLRFTNPCDERRIQLKIVRVAFEQAQQAPALRLRQRRENGCVRNTYMFRSRKFVPGGRPTISYPFQRQLLPRRIPASALAASPDSRPMPVSALLAALHRDPPL